MDCLRKQKSFLEKGRLSWTIRQRMHLTQAKMQATHPVIQQTAAKIIQTTQETAQAAKTVPMTAKIQATLTHRTATANQKK